MYKSPIDVTVFDSVNDVVNDINGKLDEAIMMKVKTCVNVDKDALIKALKYDRNQYEKGYRDGMLDAVPVVRCKDCKNRSISGVCEYHFVVTLDDWFCWAGEEIVGGKK